jgi:hypothetical protein
MDNRAAYKGYIIDAHPYQLADDGRWSTDLNVERHNNEGVNVSQYSGALTFGTKDEAIQHCFGMGAQIIDGEYPGCNAPQSARLGALRTSCLDSC